MDSSAEVVVSKPSAGLPSATVPANRSGRIPELDGLRGLAILLVIHRHFVNLAVLPGQKGLAFRVAEFFQLGWSGVDLFFVLSGFLIGGILLDVRDSPRYFRTFYLRRFFRIVPLYYAWLAIFAVLVFGIGRWLPDSLRLADESPRLLPVYLFFLQNLRGYPKNFFSLHWLAPMWSLAVEEQFYLVAPIFIRFLSLRRLVTLLLLAVVGAPVFRITLIHFRHPAAVFQWMPSRADALALGMLAAVVWRSPAAKSWLARRQKGLYYVLSLLFAGVLMMNSIPELSGRNAAGLTWLALFYVTLMLVVLLDPAGILARLSRAGFLRECGCLSYCMYIIHWGINANFHALLLGSEPNILDPAGFLTTLLAAGAVWGIAKVSWLYFEKPLLRRGHAYQY